jgi:hypothetical protein
MGEALDKSAHDRAAEDFERFTSRLLQGLPALRTARLPRGCDDFSDAEGPWKAFLHLLCCLQGDNICASPECTKALVGSDHQFQLCGGCRRIVYCSRRCQKHAWNYARVPHRRICGPLRRMCTANDLKRTLFCSEVEQRVKEVPEAFDARQAALITNHLHLQTRYEMSTLCTCRSGDQSPVGD